MRRIYWINAFTSAVVAAIVSFLAFLTYDQVTKYDMPIQEVPKVAAQEEASGDKGVSEATGAQSASGNEIEGAQGLTAIAESDRLFVFLKALIWPCTLLIGLFFVAYNHRLGKALGLTTRLIRKISAGGVQIEINSETVQLVQRQLNGTFQELVNGSAEEYERLALVQDVYGHMKSAVINNQLKDIDNVRATVHVDDVIFSEYLYQLVDYYPSGEGAHRRNSHRYGIIGRTWRSGVSHGTGNSLAGEGSRDALVENWGMTEEEAQGQVGERPSSLSIVIRDGNVPVGILFVDSTKKNAFGDDHEATVTAEEISNSDSVKKLGEVLGAVLAPMRASAPTIRING